VLDEARITPLPSPKRSGIVVGGEGGGGEGEGGGGEGEGEGGGGEGGGGEGGTRHTAPKLLEQGASFQAPF